MDVARVTWSEGGKKLLVCDGTQVTVRHGENLAVESVVEHGELEVVGCGEAVGGNIGVWGEEGKVIVKKTGEEYPLGENVVAVESRVVGKRTSTAIHNKGGSVRASDTVVIFMKSTRTKSSISMYLPRTKETILLAEDKVAYGHLSVSSPEPCTIAYTTPNNNLAYCLQLSSTHDPVKLSCTFRPTALAVHPHQPVVTIGEANGRIRSWSMEHAGEPSLHEVHWHAHPVSVLKYNSDGTTLASGGEEAVLMLWNTRSWTSNKIARLPGQILLAEWSEDDAKMVIGCAPGTLMIIDIAQRKPSAVVHGDNLLLGQPCSGIQKIRMPSGDCIALEGMESMVRIFDPVKKSFLRTLKISASNVSSKVDNSALPKITVKHLTVSPTGQHMVTYEESDVSMNGRAVSTLRFWNISGDNLEWKVNTYIDAPHGDDKVTSVVYDQKKGRDFAITTGENGNVKKWRFAGERWSLQTSLQLNCSKSMSSAVSEDGTVLAVAADNSVSCLLFGGLREVGMLLQHLEGSPLESVVFPKYENGKEGVVAAGKSHCFGWDLSTRGLTFAIDLPTTPIIATCTSGYLIAAGTSLFRFTSPTPTPTQSATLTTTPTAIISLTTATAYVDSTGFLRYLTPQEITQLLGEKQGGSVKEEVKQEVATAAILPAAGLFKVHSGKAKNAGGAGQQTGSPAFTDPLASCGALLPFYEGTTYSLQASSTSLPPLLDNLFTYE